MSTMMTAMSRHNSNVDPRIQVAVVMLTARCNMACTFCINENSMRSLAWAEAMELLSHLKARGISNLVLGGGEPLMWPHDVKKLAEVAKAQGFLTQLGTNAIHLQVGFENDLRFDRYVIPLDSMIPEIHDHMRVFSSSHFKVVESVLQKLAMASKPTTVSTVITKENLTGLRAIGEFLHSLERQSPFLHAWHLYKFVPEGRGGAKFEDQLAITTEEYQKACVEVLEMGLPFKIFRRPDMMNSKTVEFFWKENKRIVSRAGPVFGSVLEI